MSLKGSDNLRLRKKSNINEKLQQFSDFVFFPDDTFQLTKNEDRKLYVELGTGKGDFISQLAERNLNVDFIGIEAESTVLYAAARKIRDKKLKNVRLLVFNVNNIDELFAENDVDRFYINFCDPWPKKRHAKRRLTHINFLEKYRRILKPDGEIQFKTDNRGLFDFSLEQFELANIKVSECTYDLHADNPLDNIQTEYEHKFSSLGVPICRCVCKF